VNRERERLREECEGSMKIGFIGISCNDGWWIKLATVGDRFLFICDMFRVLVYHIGVAEKSGLVY
jgi:hypothetical protein